ncbi:hypothetical protein ABB37_06322 [Leptomonas pyrrhocoris]|uniref:Transmembrane protein n=1 Tax=Leptomonas pyrrhocoris TaxID=157538 RepID=A0A0M9FXK2_LEPPY|nr:hypothetical protein ABB37_06322 [Leptomonas pyrrhocoris]XP_015656584.1 hypothetical protein ABB37_06322 [Leptomonas pyrrhocoris]KPA78144.1 hypothetical protein ABB37_06322 [Leptomonas pyrrhocoris]KPA78145.1 hypothetical protein ABB37_06322 [Leptomonas pyrrhocoris]|eukprot:XP_015656583.1 hypothetical protein ABB37_06322 [Leptomonas pyrrhocoris]
MARHLPMRARGLRSTSSSSLPPLLLVCGLAAAFFFVLVATTAHAATATRNPTVVSHFGDTIPLTMYLRLKRQTQRSFLFPDDPADAAINLDEGAVHEDVEGNVVVEDPAEGKAAGANGLPDEWNIRDLELPALGATTGKHSSQIVRNLPPTYAPRFGINRAVTLVMKAPLSTAGKTLEDDPTLQQSDLAVRFSVGRGLQKESTWLPLASRHKVVSMLTELLVNRLQAPREAERAELEREFDEVTENAHGPAVHYLSRVTFYFGYQTGEQHKFTSFAIDASYSPVKKAGIDLHFIWSEHRPYNPNRALVLCTAASLLAAMMMVVVVFHPSSRSMLLFSQRIVAVRAHE